MSQRQLAIMWIGIALVTSISGCGGPQLPQFTEVEGRVMLNGEPLPNAAIQFAPELKGLGSIYNSDAVSDEEGKFTLVCRKTGDPGAVISWHRVVVMDSIPSELRGHSEEAQERRAEYYDKLKNRPIPERYSSIVRTPLRIEVKSEQKIYTLLLSRVD